MFSSRGSNTYGQQSYSGKYGQNEADASGYRGHPSAASHYENRYGSMYGSASLGASQQLPSIGGKRAGPSTLEGRGSYTSAIADSPKISYGDYIPTSSHIYNPKSYAEKVPDYSAIERHPYVERHGTYIERDLQTEPTRRFADPVGFGHQHQSESYDRIDQASLLRQEQFLKAQSIQPTSLDRARFINPN